MPAFAANISKPLISPTDNPVVARALSVETAESNAALLMRIIAVVAEVTALESSATTAPNAPNWANILRPGNALDSPAKIEDPKVPEAGAAGGGVGGLTGPMNSIIPGKGREGAEGVGVAVGDAALGVAAAAAGVRGNLIFTIPNCFKAATARSADAAILLRVVSNERILSRSLPSTLKPSSTNRDAIFTVLC